jgi:cytochrome c-type biogenesis protein CcmH
MMFFWVCATFLSLCALSFVLVPALRESKKTGRWSVLNMTSAALLVPLSVGMYLVLSTWNGDASSDAALPPLSDLIIGLETSLNENPEDAVGWQLLGQSYLAVGRFPEARQALREAWGRTLAPDNDLKLALGEAEVMTDRTALTGEAGRIFEEVLENDPSNPKALWYGGLAALDMEQPNVARERWVRLLSLNPPDQIAIVLREQIGLLGEFSDDNPALVENTDSETENLASFQLQLNVTLADGLSIESMGPQAALFIFARAPQGGPPLAVIRQEASAVPGVFSLSDANAMLPGRSLTDFESLTIVARLSSSGQPTASSGDFYGELVYNTADGDGQVNLQINQIEN